MNKINKIPVYRLDKQAIINDIDSGVFTVSLVSEPAIMRSFQVFDKLDKNKTDKSIINYKIFDDDKYIISGYAMLANLPILRVDENGSYYYINYNKDDIKTLQNQFMKRSDIHSTNLQHDNKMKLSKDDLFMIESFLIDSKRGINKPVGFEDGTDGSWFVSYSVPNKDLYNKIKSGELNLTGFSVELAGYHQLKSEENEQTLIDIINRLK